MYPRNHGKTLARKIQAQIMKTSITPTQRAAAEQAIGYLEAWYAKNTGPTIGSVKVLVTMLERAAGPEAMAEAFDSWEERTRLSA